MLESGFASGLGQTASQNPTLSRRTFLLALTSLLALGLPQGSQAQADFAPFSFAFISDVHLCIGLADNTALLQESQLFLQDVVKQLNLRKLDFVIFGGDQVEGPGKDDVFWNLFIDVLQILNAPWYFILGEADVSGRLAIDKMVEYGPDFKGRGLTSGKPYWSVDPVANVHLVGLDTSRPNTSTGDLSVEQLGWLKSDLEANKGKLTIIVSHHPLLAPPPYDGGPPWDDYMVLQGASAREILGASRDVRLCVSGHVPVNKVQQEGGIWYVAASTLAIYPCQFKIFTVSPQAVHVETLQVSYDALVKKAKKIMETSRVAFQYSSTRPQSFLKIAEGEELDRNAILPLVSASVSQKANKKKDKGKDKNKGGKKEKTHRSEKENKNTSPDKEKHKKTKQVEEDTKDKAEPADKTVPADKTARSDKAVPSDKAASTNKATPADKTMPSDKTASTNKATPADKTVPSDKTTKPNTSGKTDAASASDTSEAGTSPTPSK